MGGGGREGAESSDVIHHSAARSFKPSGRDGHALLGLFLFTSCSLFLQNMSSLEKHSAAENKQDSKENRKHKHNQDQKV